MDLNKALFIIRTGEYLDTAELLLAARTVAGAAPSLPQDPRDEALRVAREAFEKMDTLTYSFESRSRMEQIRAETFAKIKELGEMSDTMQIGTCASAVDCGYPCCIHTGRCFKSLERENAELRKQLKQAEARCKSLFDALEWYGDHLPVCDMPMPIEEVEITLILTKLFSSDDAERWLNEPHELLGMARPIDLLHIGQYGRVLSVLRQITDGAYI